MKLLIDIPEHIYEHAKEMTEDSRDEGVAMRAIANGTPARCKGMNEAEKERLIKKNMLSMENKVRHAFNQGYEMGVKAYKENMLSRSEIPNTCGDAISRQAVIDRINKQREGLEPEIYPQDKIGDRAYRICIEFIKNDLPSVTPQPKMGRWIQKEEEGEAEPFIIWECSECHCVDEDGKPSYKYCPMCGARMEVQG